MYVIKKIGMALAIITISLTAQAQSFYIHAGAGQSMLTSQYTTANNPEGYVGLIGYRFSKVGIEAAHYDLGKIGNTTTGFEVKMKATSLNFVRTFEYQESNGPLFNVLVKVGLARVISSAKGVPAQLALSDKLTKNGLTYGLGARAALDANWFLRIDIDSLDTGIPDAGRTQTITGGIGYDF